MLIIVFVIFFVTSIVLITTRFFNKTFQFPVYEYIIVPSKKAIIYTYIFYAMAVLFLGLSGLIYVIENDIVVSSIFCFWGMLCAIGVVGESLLTCCSYIAFDGCGTITVHNCFKHKTVDATQIERIYSFRGIIHFAIEDKRGLLKDLFTINSTSINSAEFVHAVDAIAKTPDE